MQAALSRLLLTVSHISLFRRNRLPSSAAAGRPQERIELEMIGDRQMWPRAVWGAPGGGGYMYSEHCEGHLMANYCTCLGLCAIPFCVNCCVGGCDYCCCYMAARRRKLRIRYKLKGNPCMDYCFAGCLPFFLGFLAGGPGGLAAYQEVC